MPAAALRQPAEHPHHEQVDQTDEHESRALKQQLRPYAGLWRGTGNYLFFPKGYALSCHAVTPDCPSPLDRQAPLAA
jgi:hypothetical protein